MRCIHSSQRCISSRQMTDNIFEIETTALGQVVCAPPNSGVLCRGISQCHHSWISITHVDFVGARRRQFLMARGVRQGCLANGFLFAMAFDPIFRWLQESIILMNVDNLESLQLTQRPYIEDLAIASSSFRELMFARAPAFRTIDCIVGSNLNFRNCCWVQTGNEDHDSRRTWSRKIVKNSVKCRLFDTPKDVGTMTVPDGHLHRWTAHLKKFIQRVMKINFSTKGLFQRLIFEICEMSVLSFIASSKPPSMPRTMPFGVPQQDRTTLFLFTISGGLHVWTWPCFGWHSSYQSSGSPSGCSMLLHSPQRSRKSQWGTRAQLHSSLCSFSHLGTGVSFSFHDLSHGESILHFLPIGPWDTLDEALQNQKNQKVATSLLVDKLRTQDSAGLSACRASRVLGLISRHRVVDILLHMKRVSCASRPVLLVDFLRILWKGPCVARRFHSIESDNTCHVGCPEDSLSSKWVSQVV